MQGKKPQPVWLDCDPGLDDTFAIIYAGIDKGINLIGVSTSPGNTSLDNTTQNALNVLYNIGREDVEVIRGSNQILKGKMNLAEHMHGSNGLGGVELPVSPRKAHTEKNFTQIYDKLNAVEGQVTWCNTGSLTNLCILLLTYPEIKKKISRIVMMGGAVEKGNITPAAQFNIYFDPHAMAEVLNLKGDIPLVMIPLEVTHQNMALQPVFDELSAKAEKIPFARALHTMLCHFKKGYKSLYDIDFPPIHDPLTLFYLLHPDEIETKKANIEVDTYPTSFGRTNVYFYDHLDSNKEIVSNNYVATNLRCSEVRFWDEMMRLLDVVFSEEIQSKIKR